MCTAVSYLNGGHYFGRNLDLDHSYHETVTIVPRNCPFHFRKENVLERHYAMIGMAYVCDDYPLYYEATNEKGLSMAGLSFPDNAIYHEECSNKENIAPFELIPWILGQCGSMNEAIEKLSNLNIVKIHFSSELPLSPLHWMISDRCKSIVVESLRDGIHIHDNPTGVMTNNPTFDYHLLHLSDYMGVSASPPENKFSRTLSLKPYSLGMGGIGIPGDFSSASRFVRAAFVRENSMADVNEASSVSQFFHILDAAAQIRGCTELKNGRYEYTLYSSCCSTDKGIYYYKTYENSRITAVDMNQEDLDGDELISYPLVKNQDFYFQNQ